MTEAIDSYYLLDANVLVALTNVAHVHHRQAHAWFAGIDRWATTPITESAFLRLQMNPAVVGQAIGFSAAQAALRALRSSPGHAWLPDDTTLADPVISCTSLMGHRQVTDFHLVNCAARAGARLATFDASLARALGRQANHVLVIPD